MDLRLGRQQAQRLLSEPLRIDGLVVGQCRAAAVIGGIRRLPLPQRGGRRLITFAADVAAGRQRRGRLAIFLHALGGWRMTREQRREAARARAALLGEAHERFLERDRGARVVAGRRHVAHAVEIRFELRPAAVALRDQLRADAGRADSKPAVIAALRRHLSREQCALQQHAALHGQRAVSSGRVHDLVAEHGRELGFRLKLREQPAIHRDLAAGQRPSVRHGTVQYDGLVG